MRFNELYQKQVRPALKKEFSYKSDLAIPRITKVSLNVGVGRFTKDKAYVDGVVNTLTRISGQKPVLTKSRKSISAFKVREGQIVGVAVNLRGARMFDFLEKLINITFPRVRDFRGIDAKIIDRTGNMSIGFREHIAFPEVKADEIDNVHGLQITISTTAKTREEGFELFKLLGFPFKKTT
ncbi:MAG: 50S ribosomal protein L5 [Candidatus Falkowbacteria bacterium]|nr:50S ribosomal protein L5 [Candidatus Falkowbacteria bacterium]